MVLNTWFSCILLVVGKTDHTTSLSEKINDHATLLSVAAARVNELMFPPHCETKMTYSTHSKASCEDNQLRY